MNSLTYLCCVLIYIVFFIALYQLRSVRCLSYTNKWNWNERKHDCQITCVLRNSLFRIAYSNYKLQNNVINRVMLDSLRYIIERLQVRINWNCNATAQGRKASLPMVRCHWSLAATLFTAIEPCRGLCGRHHRVHWTCAIASWHAFQSHRFSQFDTTTSKTLCLTSM